ncbi:hypothetical protein [Kineococcus glutinatus]|uniref:Uncharacterized protein n=1 Tax=Kineococcus glutinatus TaxID=1070872 RepID=A0ABP9HIY3_9ACTN
MADRRDLQPGDRCAAAHVEDSSPCRGAPDAVRVVDAAGGSLMACVEHGATLLASLQGGRVYPGSQPEAAVEVFTLAHHRAPFAFRDGGDIDLDTEAVYGRDGHRITTAEVEELAERIERDGPPPRRET